MLRRLISDSAKLRKEHPKFFWFSILVLAFYALQMVIRTEITPLGYFSLYSNPMQEQESYHQILPYDTLAQRPVDIYKTPGTGFLMMEILPTRYDILKHSDHCNQMNHKLRRIGLGDDNLEDCIRLMEFDRWFKRYGVVQGLDLSNTILMDCGFKNGKLIKMKRLDDKTDNQ